MQRYILALILIGVSFSGLRSEEAPRPVSIGSKDAIDEMARQVLGRVTQPMHVNWRQHSVEVGVHWGTYLEYNNFRSDVRGILLRFPTDSVVFRLGLDQVKVVSTESSRELAQTRYRQWGRPSRYEIKPGIVLPLIDAMTFPQWSWVPPAQISLSALISLHQVYYPEAPGFGAMTSKDLNKLVKITPGGMEVSPERNWATWGLETAVYYRSGLWLYFDAVTSQLVMASENLPRAYEFSLGVGYAF